jgi:EmrB/QacA subfamily drug resistance transporter
MRSALFVTSLASFLTPFMSSAVNIALPQIGEDLDVDVVLLAWVGTAFLLAVAAFLVPFGRVADLHGRKRVFMWGVGLWTTFSLLCGLATSGEMLVALRFAQGVGGAMLFGTSVAILSSVFPASERGRAIGINVAAVYLGLSVGPTVGGVLTDVLGWRSVFLINVPFGFAIVAAVAWRLRGEWAGARGQAFDAPGAALYMAMVLLTMVGFAVQPNTEGLVLLPLGAVALVGFIAWERRTPSPVLDIGLFRGNRVFAMSNVAALISYAATFSVGFFMSIYLQEVKGLEARVAGLVMLAQPIVQAALSPAAGRLSDRIEPRFVASAGMAMQVTGLLVLVLLDEGTAIGLVVAGLAALGLGFALFSSPNTNAVMSAVGRTQYGVASSMVATMRALGQVSSMGFASMLLGIYVGTNKISEGFQAEFMDATHVAFMVFSVLCLAGMFASLVRGNVRGNGTGGAEGSGGGTGA